MIARASATSHPSQATAFDRVPGRLVRFFSIPLTFALPGAELGHRLFQRVQDGDLTLRIVEFEPFKPRFEPVQPLTQRNVVLALLPLQSRSGFPGVARPPHVCHYNTS